MAERNINRPAPDGIDRRGFLQCMAWAGTGVVWSMAGGILTSRAFGEDPPTPPDSATFNFVQLSDSHIGFAKDPNKNVTDTLKIAIDRVNQMSAPPELILNTGDLTHLSKPSEFDTVAQLLKTARTGQIFYVPGEHDVFTDDGKSYLERYGKGTTGNGYQSFNTKGVHFVGLVNVLNLKAGGLGVLGDEQLAWLEKDLAPLGASTPIVVFAHVPLWTVYEPWGWGTQDSARAMALLKRFGSVTVLNGHIHQVLQKVEGNITFHTALSTSFPQPAPGKAKSPGPMKGVAADKLKSMLGLASVTCKLNAGELAIVDSNLA